MASKNIGRILSGCAIALSIVLLCAADIGAQTFTPTRITYTISGSVGLPGVTMKGLPDGAVVTDESGNYSAKVVHNWSGEITPVKEGYTFEPVSRPYAQLKSNQTVQNYVATPVTYTISGTAGVPGVIMDGLPGNPLSDANGLYSAVVNFDWIGTVAPMKQGYKFTPGSRPFQKVRQNQTNQNFTAEVLKFTISGTAGVDGVVMQGLPGNPVTSGAGTYSVPVDWNWSGTVTPKKEGYVFDPSNKPYTPIISSLSNENYKATPLTYVISGTTGVPGVLMKGLPDNPVTDDKGYYKAVVQHGWDATVTPMKDGYTFEPSSRPYAKITQEQTNQSYTATPIILGISGTTGVEGVTMTGLPGEPVTDVNGNYAAKVAYNWSGTVTPMKEGYKFTPASLAYEPVLVNRAKQDYIGQLITLQISGTAGVGKAVMEGLPNNLVAGPDGSYLANVPWGWKGTVAPKLAGYDFEPPKKEYARVTSAATNESYTATLQKRVISGRISSDKGPIEGALVLADKGGGSAMTNPNGEYKLSVDYGWSGKLTPSKPGHTFTPVERTYPLVTTDQTTQGYTGELIMLTISGNTGIEGVRVTATDAGSVVTGADGKYQIKVPYGWSGTVTPEKEGYTFEPASVPYTNVTTDIIEGKPVPPTPPETTRVGPTTPPETTRVGPTIPPETTRVGPTTPPETTRVGPTTPPETTRVGPTTPPETTRVGPTTPVTTASDQEKTLLQRELAILQEKMNQLILQLSGQTPGPNVPLTIVGPSVPGGKLIVKGNGPLVSAVFVDTDLVDALKELASKTGVEIHTDGTIKGRVTRQIPQVPLARALEILLQGTGYAVKEVPNSYLVYTPISNIFSETDLRIALQDIATAAQVVIIPDESITGTISCELKGVPLDTALEMVLAGTGFVVKKTPYYYLVSSSDPTSPGFANVSETRRLKMSYMKCDDAVKLLSQSFQRYVKSDANTVCVTAPPILLERIVGDLKRIDQPSRHVMLDARVVVMERGNLLNLGVEWGWPQIQAGLFGQSDLHGGRRYAEAAAAGLPISPRAEWPWGVQMGYSPDGTFTNALLLTLNLLSENGEADIVASPQVMAQDGKRSEIRVMTEEYYMMTSPQGGYGGFYTPAQLETIKSGTTLSITPRIGDNNEISLEIAVEVSDSIPRGRGSDLPVVTRRTATNAVRIKDGGTVALAGLTESRRRSSEKRVPGLSGLPVIGFLFRNTDSDKSTREIAVFITAHLIPEAGQGVLEIAEPSAEKPPEIKPAEQQLFQQNLQKNLTQPTRQVPSEAAGDQFERLLKESLAQPIR
jgi:type II secretory pathway component GspD/PulD (secretin)